METWHGELLQKISKSKMPREKERKLLGMPRSTTGKRFLVIKTSKANKFIVQPLK